MKSESFDFYDRTVLKSYNLDERMRDQLNALGSLDVFTRKHCENVAAITCRLCEYLHCSKQFTEYCTICAYLHDIGKIFIPPEVLQKPGKLTEEEYSIMKTHTTIGYNMCMKDPKLRPFVAGPCYHHEALNGSGYPRGLTIPYEGQIIRVADEYDAIVSKRQYKSHVGISDTIKILIENAQANKSLNNGKLSKYGKNNPAIVKVLIKVVLDDIYYEIYCIQEYMKYLNENIKRLENANKYYEKKQKSSSERKRQYFDEYMKMYLQNGENSENFFNVYNEYLNAYNVKVAKIEHLNKEIKVIKKLKI